MISSARTPPRDGLSALLAVVPRVLRAKWIGLIAGVLGLAGTAVGVLLTTRLYRSEAVLVYEKGLAATGDESSRGLGIRLQDAFSSRVRLEGLIKKNKLYPRLVRKRGLVEAAEEMNLHVKVLLREGYAYRISYDTDDRDRAQDVLTQLVNSVIDEESERRRRQADETKRFLDAERARADEELKVKEAALGNFLSRHPQLAGVTGAAPGGTIRAAESGAGPADTFGLEMQAANIEDAIAKAKTAQPGQPVMKGGRMLDPTLAAAQSKAAADLQTARRDLAAKEARFTNDHPDVKAAVIAANQAEKAYRHAEAAAAASATTSSTAPSGDAPAADGSASGAGQTASLQRALAAIRGQIGAMRARSAPRREVERDLKTSVAVDTEWSELARAASEARERQQQLETRQFQAQLTATLVAANQAGGLTIVDPPFRPMKPITGGRSKVAIGGGLGSLVLALAAMLLAAKFDRRIYGVEDIVRVYPVEILVEVPRLEAAKSE
jgi:protein tyrosine kinase modulator